MFELIMSVAIEDADKKPVIEQVLQCSPASYSHLEDINVFLRPAFAFTANSLFEPDDWAFWMQKLQWSSESDVILMYRQINESEWCYRKLTDVFDATMKSLIKGWIE